MRLFTILKTTLTDLDGQWSGKRITAFSFSAWAQLVIAIFCWKLYKDNVFAWEHFSEVLWTLVAFISSLFGLTGVDRYLSGKNQQPPTSQP